MTEIKEKRDETITAQADDANLFTAAATYKDRIFRMIFKEKKEFLELYNAMNGSSYNNPDSLIVTTLDNAIYLGMKNDVSFLLYDKLMLYEHQSTNNPNMPLRNLFYVSDIYSKLVKDKNLFGTKLIRIPEPKFVVFYNGMAKVPENFTMRLSDMFESISEEPSLDLVTQVYNINLGYNKALMEKCRTLHDYAAFVDLVRRYKRKMALQTAVELAIEECIAHNVLTDFLKANKAEVLKMGLYEYDEEKYIQMEREDAKEEGIQEGLSIGFFTLLSAIRKKYLKGKSLDTIACELETDVADIQDIYELLAQNPEIEDKVIAENLIKLRS